MPLKPFSWAMSRRNRAKFSSLSTMRSTRSPGWIASRSSETSRGAGAETGAGSRTASRSERSETTLTDGGGAGSVRDVCFGGTYDCGR